ncbi:hypothetical protein IQ06DRAFT_77986 [Phaeosphaeriaceae sp. SRC1lsM3a]|nr:hypothetical protein IQ06DRAFT_77986 [Stagonospora sp. SRC1lsM3a]
MSAAQADMRQCFPTRSSTELSLQRAPTLEDHPQLICVGWLRTANRPKLISWCLVRLATRSPKGASCFRVACTCRTNRLAGAIFQKLQQTGFACKITHSQLAPLPKKRCVTEATVFLWRTKLNQRRRETCQQGRIKPQTCGRKPFTSTVMWQLGSLHGRQDLGHRNIPCPKVDAGLMCVYVTCDRDISLAGHVQSRRRPLCNISAINHILRASANNLIASHGQTALHSIEAAHDRRLETS